MPFFEGPYIHFFAPLSRSKREKFALALEALYEELYSPDSAHGVHFDRRALLITIEHAIAQAPDEIAAIMSDEPGEAGELTSTQCAVELEERGWLEAYRDSVSIHLLYRLTPIGKKFARLFWERTHPPALTHNRHMRSCDSLLKQFLASGDAADLVDAEIAAAQVLEEFTREIEDLRIRVRVRVREAQQQRVAVEEFAGFITERFRKELDPKLMADSPTRLKGSIQASLEQLRALPDARLDAMERSLRELIVGGDERDELQVLILAERIEAHVRHAVDAGVPELLGVVSRYVDRMVSLMRQSVASRAGARDPLLDLLAGLRLLPDEVRDEGLDYVGLLLAPARLRLVDPADVKVREARRSEHEGEPVLEVARDPESELQAAVRRRFDEELGVGEQDVLERLLSLAERRSGRIRLSQIPIVEARDLLIALGAESSLRSLAKKYPVDIRAVPAQVHNPYFSTQDVEFVFHGENEAPRE